MVFINCPPDVHWEESGSEAVDLMADRTAGNRVSVTANTMNTLIAYSHIWREREELVSHDNQVIVLL